MDSWGPFLKNAPFIRCIKKSDRLFVSSASSFPSFCGQRTCGSAPLLFASLPAVVLSLVSPTRPALPQLSHAPHVHRREQPAPRRQGHLCPVEFYGSSTAAVVSRAAPRFLLAHPQLGHAPRAPLLQERPRLVARARARVSGYPVPGQGEAPPPRGRRVAAAPARRSSAVEPSDPPLRHRRPDASGGIARIGRGGRGRGARACADCGGKEAGVLRRAVQAGDRRGLRGDSRDTAPAPAQEATSHGAAAARLAVPGIVPSRCGARLLQDRGEVIELPMDGFLQTL